jgi:DNA-binding NarL/FixJ family response regulator
VEASEQPPKAVLPPELASVADAAGRRLRAEVDGDKQAAEAGAQSLLRAATSAMNAGYSLTQITQAETQGKLDVRASLRPDTLKQVKRTGRIVRDAEAEHHRTIVRAVRLGLSTRQIAAAAGVTHGTVRAITNRLTGQSPTE